MNRRSSRSAATAPTPVTPLDHAVRQFANFLLLEKGVAVRTSESYGHDLRSYVTYLKRHSIDRPRDITADHVRGFLGSLRATGLSARSIARTLAVVRGFHRFLLSEETAASDPTEDVGSPKRPNT